MYKESNVFCYVLFLNLNIRKTVPEEVGQLCWLLGQLLIAVVVVAVVLMIGS